ncbi:MAG TPA: SRPBCC domain-containing protein [Myxococcota bacterium]|nr:SRPBCC domain-containing protein [Myxococcota bacterium]
MADSLHEITIAAPVRKVYEAWTTQMGIASWWTADCELGDGPGDVNVFSFHGRSVLFHFHVDAQVSPLRVQWTGIAGPKMPEEWIGTTIDLQLVSEAEGTRVRFAHRDWRSSEGAFRACNTTWGALMYRLRDACEGRNPGPLFR